MTITNPFDEHWNTELDNQLARLSVLGSVRYSRGSNGHIDSLDSISFHDKYFSLYKRLYKEAENSLSLLYRAITHIEEGGRLTAEAIYVMKYIFDILRNNSGHPICKLGMRESLFFGNIMVGGENNYPLAHIGEDNRGNLVLTKLSSHRVLRGDTYVHDLMVTNTSQVRRCSLYIRKEELDNTNSQELRRLRNQTLDNTSLSIIEPRIPSMGMNSRRTMETAARYLSSVSRHITRIEKDHQEALITQALMLINGPIRRTLPLYKRDTLSQSYIGEQNGLHAAGRTPPNNHYLSNQVKTHLLKNSTNIFTIIIPNAISKLYELNNILRRELNS